MTSKGIEGHKSSSNFSVNPTLPFIGCFPLKIVLSFSLSIYPFLLYAKIIYTQWNVFRHALSLSLLRKVILGIRLSNQTFLWCFLGRPLFTLYFAVWKILRGIKGLIFSFSLSSYFHSLSLSMPLPFTLSLISLNSLSLLSIVLSGVSNGRFCPCL